MSVSPAFTEMYLFYLAKCSSIVSHTKFEVFGWREVDKPFISSCEFCFCESLEKVTFNLSLCRQIIQAKPLVLLMWKSFIFTKYCEQCGRKRWQCISFPGNLLMVFTLQRPLFTFPIHPIPPSPRVHTPIITVLNREE